MFGTTVNNIRDSDTL